MKAYYLVFFITFLIQFVFPAKDDKSYLRRTIITFIPLFLYGALRVDYGLDYAAYERDFQFVHSLSFSDCFQYEGHSEIGYVILERIIPTWRLLVIITTALTCIAYGRLFYKCIPPKYSWLAIILLFLAGDKTIFFQFSGIRNAIAIAIMILSFPLIRDRKILPYLALTLLAIAFHTTAILFMPIAYFLGSSKPMSKNEGMIWIIAMLFLQVVSLNALFDQMTEIVGLYFDRYEVYLDKFEGSSGRFSFLIRSFVAFFIIMIVRFMRMTKLSENENVICRLTLFFFLSYIFGAMSFRMSQCFGFIFVCGATIVFAMWKNDLARQSFIWGTLIYLFYAFYIVYLSKPEFPYQVYNSILGGLF